jgi:flotillin
MVPTLLLVEQMPELIEQQVKAIQALKIDKITVWDNGGRSKNENGATANFLKDIINVLPPIHDLAKQVGIELPSYFGKLKMEDSSPVTSRNGDDSEISEPIL